MCTVHVVGHSQLLIYFGGLLVGAFVRACMHANMRVRASVRVHVC